MARRRQGFACQNPGAARRKRAGERRKGPGRIMILRRLIDNIKRQAWTAIVIEFVIVVIGIFVGMQVNNWNAERSNRALEETHLKQLAKDIRSDIAEIDRI